MGKLTQFLKRETKSKTSTMEKDGLEKGIAAETVTEENKTVEAPITENGSTMPPEDNTPGLGVEPDAEPEAEFEAPITEEEWKSLDKFELRERIDEIATALRNRDKSIEDRAATSDLVCAMQARLNTL